jgi:hypothetical protein
MRPPILPAALLAALVLLAVPGPAFAAPVEERAALGATHATLAYDRDGYEVTGMTLTVARGGEVAVDGLLALEGCEEPFCLPGGVGSSSVRVVDLDGDGEPEVLLDVFTGGAHCCVATRLLRWDGSGYAAADHDWRDPGYRLRDLEGDGAPELVSADARFAYRFASFAGSAMPVAVWGLREGRLTEVTQDHLDLVRRDAARWLRIWRGRRGDRGREALGVLAAWAADEYRLGHRAQVRRHLRVALRRGWLRGAQGRPRGGRFIRELDRFLLRAGYAPPRGG